MVHLIVYAILCVGSLYGWNRLDGALLTIQKEYEKTETVEEVESRITRYRGVGLT